MNLTKGASGLLFLLRRVPSVGKLVTLILMAGVAEGLGLSALIPVVYTLTGEHAQGGLPMPFRLLPEGLERLGFGTGFVPLIALTLATMLTAFVVIYVQDRFVARSRYRFLRQLRDDADNAIFAARWERLAKISTGEVVNQILVESDRGVEAHYALIQMVATSMQLAVYIGFALVLSWEMSLVALMIIFVSALSGRRLIRRTRRLGKEVTHINDIYSRQLVDYLKTVKLIKASGAEENIREHLAASNLSSSETLRAIVVNQATMRFELQALVSVVVVSILYLAIEVLRLEVSILLMFMYIVMRMAPKFSMLQSQHHMFTAFRPAMEKVDRLVNELRIAADDINPSGTSFQGVGQSLVLQSVTYRHQNSERDALHGIDLCIPKGRMVALVGPSGGGKSTALDLLIGLTAPTSGQVLVDGQDLRAFDQRSYRRRIGFVPQESALFSGTIRQNVTLFDAIDDERLWHALELAQIADFVKEQPAGLDTEIGESGVRLSGGQRQRLSIARALVRAPSLLVLDEATSALDGESERRFQKAIEGLAGCFTLVVVAHRLATVRRADWIYVLKDGVIVEQGGYAALAAVNGPFAAMLQAQDLSDEGGGQDAENG